MRWLEQLAELDAGVPARVARRGRLPWLCVGLLLFLGLVVDLMLTSKVVDEATVSVVDVSLTVFGVVIPR